VNTSRPKHTPGPYEIHVIANERNLEIRSAVTGECIAHVFSNDSAPLHKVSPQDETAVYNAVLMRAAPRMRESLQGLVRSENVVSPETASEIRKLLSEIDTGAESALLQNRAKQLERDEEIKQAQVMEMSLQSDRSDQRRLKRKSQKRDIRLTGEALW